MTETANGPAPEPEDRAVPEPDRPIRIADADRFRRSRPLLVLGALIAGLSAFGIGEATYNVIPPEQVLQNTMGRMMMAVTPGNQIVADTRNAAMTFGVLGGCLGASLGIAGGLARRSIPAAVAAGLLGLIGGAGLAVGISFAAVAPLDEARLARPEYEMGFSMLMHAMIWGLSGAVAGLAFAVGLGTGWRGLAAAKLAGLVGAVLGSIAFDLVGAALFPLANTGDPVSTTWASRLTARMLVALGIAAAMIVSLRGARSAPSADRGGERSKP